MFMTLKDKICIVMGSAARREMPRHLLYSWRGGEEEFDGEQG